MEGKMYRVGIKELKNKFSHYIGQVKKGEHITVTDRGRPIALIVPSEGGEVMERLMSLVRGGFAFWKGGKPTGSAHPVPLRGKPVADIVLEGRR